MVEIVACPNCQRKLQIPEDFFGQLVQCPECQHRFIASETSLRAQSTAAPSSSPPVVPSGQSPDSKRRRHDDTDSWDGDPRRRRSRYDDEFDEFDQSRRIRQNYAPHRGGLIMALGLVSLVGGFSLCGAPAIIGPVAWALGSHDLREIREGRMDPSGESMTRAGQVCGIISTVLLLLLAAFLGLIILADTR